MNVFLKKSALVSLFGAAVYVAAWAGPLAAPNAAAQVSGGAFMPPSEARPAPGILENRTGRALEAPFEIVTSPGADYYLKLVDVSTNRDAIIIYVRGGQPFEALVPLGSYRLKYASGKTWRGTSHLFGPGDLTNYSASDSILNFRVSGGYVNGYTVELIEQAGGNMDTRRIGRSQF